MSTHCRVVQLLEPDPEAPMTVTGGTGLAIEEEGILALVVGVTEYAVPFLQTKAALDYDFIESDIDNAVDGDPLMIGFEMTERTTAGFTLVLDAQPDTVNYRFRWGVRVNSV